MLFGAHSLLPAPAGKCERAALNGSSAATRECAAKAAAEILFFLPEKPALRGREGRWALWKSLPGRGRLREFLTAFWKGSPVLRTVAIDMHLWIEPTGVV